MKSILNADRPITKLRLNSLLQPYSHASISLDNSIEDIRLKSMELYTGGYDRYSSDISDGDRIVSVVAQAVIEVEAQALATGLVSREDLNRINTEASEKAEEQAEEYSDYDANAWDPEDAVSDPSKPGVPTPDDIFSEEDEDTAREQAARDKEEAIDKVNEARARLDEASDRLDEASDAAYEAQGAFDDARIEQAAAVDSWDALTSATYGGEWREDGRYSTPDGVVTVKTNEDGSHTVTSTGVNGSTSHTYMGTAEEARTQAEGRMNEANDNLTKTAGDLANKNNDRDEAEKAYEDASKGFKDAADDAISKGASEDDVYSRE